MDEKYKKPGEKTHLSQLSIADRTIYLKNGRIARVSPCFASFIGSSTDKLLGKPIDTFRRLVGHDPRGLERWRILSGPYAGRCYRTCVVPASPDDASRQVAVFNSSPDTRIYETALKAGFDMVMVADDKLRITWANEKFLNRTGYQLQEIEGKTPMEFLQGPETDAEVVQRSLEKLAAGESSSVVFTNYDKARKPFVVDLYVEPLLDENGKVENYVAVQREVTEKIALERELAEIGRLHESVVESAELGVWQLNFKQRELIFNDQALRLVGLVRGEIEPTLEAWLNVVHSEDRAKILNAVEEHGNDSNRPIRITYRARHKQGHYVWLTSTGSVARRDEQGGGIEAHGTIIDVTEDLARERKLRRASDRLKLALTGGGFATWEYNLRTNEHFWDSEMYAMFDADDQRQLDPMEIFRRRVHPEDLESALSVMADHDSPLYSEEAKEPLHFRILTRDGDVRHIESYMTLQHDDQGEPRLIVGLNKDVTRRARLEEMLRQSSRIDYLTELPNRYFADEYLQEKLERFERGQEEAVGAFHIDIDRFKSINDSLGHRKGDLILKCFSDRLRALLWGSHEIDLPWKDALATRQAGDEFLLIVLGLRRDQMREFAEVLSKSFNQPMRIEGQEIGFSVSMGVAFANRDVRTVDQLTEAADDAMHAAKSRGRAQYCFYDEKLRDQLHLRVKVESELREAIRAEAFEMFYQPILDIRTMETVGFESLIRWKVEDGYRLPGEFIEIAESTGQIHQLGYLALKLSVAQLAEWNRVRGDHRLSLNVNVSREQLYRHDIVSQLEGLVQKHRVHPEQICLEVTESVLVQEPDSILDTLKRLRNIGVHLAVDDFGTGYSSLSVLPQLPFDTLKLDKGFLHHAMANRNAVALVRSMVFLARSLGLRVVVEGVETYDQLTMLHSMSADYVQGFYISRPKPAADAFGFKFELSKVSIPTGNGKDSGARNRK